MDVTLGEVHRLKDNMSVFYPHGNCFYWSGRDHTFRPLYKGDSVTFQTDKGLVVVPSVAQLIQNIDLSEWLIQ